MDEYKSRLSAYLSDMVREELEKYDGGFTDEWNDQRKKNAEVLGYKLSGTSDIKETKKKDSRGTERDYKKEYAKYGSSTKSKKYRAELNKYNRKKGTYGNGDGKDASHKGGKIVGFESESKNRGRAEKSRLKKESVNEGQKRFRIGHNIGRAKYVISFHNGKSKHTDGSDFWDLQIHKNKKSLEKGKEDLRQKGYFEESVNGATKSRLKKETVSRNTLRKIIREELQSVNEGLSGSILTKVKKNSKDVYGRTDYTADGNQMSYYSGNNKYYIVFHGKKGEVTKYIDMPGNVNKHDKAEKFFKDFIKKYDRTKKLESVNEAKIAHSKGGSVEVGKWYLLNYGKWKDKVKVLSIDSKVMKLYNSRDNWSYTLPMKMIKKKKIGGYMTPLQESVNEARSTNTEWNKFEKDYGDFFKTVVKLGKANTKLTGDKTDEKIFLTNFTRNVGKFYTLMKSWKRGQNESVNESIELPQGVEFGKVFTGYGKSFVKEESINEATPKEKGNLKVMKPKFKKTMDKIYKDVASIYQNLGSVEADKLKRAYIAAINRGLNPHTNMFMKHNAQKILDTAFKNESVNEECCGNCKEGKVCCDVHEKISKDEWAEYPKYARKLKPYMKKLLKVPVRVRVIKQANHNPWIEVRVSRFGKDIIPNDFRKRALKAIGGGKPRDMDNITYGNITAGSVSMKHDQWVKLLGNKVKSESVNEARTINVEPNWEGMWRFFKRMAITNPRDWKKMERKLGGEWLKIDKMAQQKGWKSESVDESGILYRAGVKKYGKEGMRKIQQAAGKRKSHAEIGKIKDKYEKESLEIDEGFGSSELMGKKDLAVFEKTRQKNAEVLGYKLTGQTDIKPIKEKSKVTK